MAAPVKRRTKKEFYRSIEFLSRLRTGILIDNRIKNGEEIIKDIDSLVSKLKPLMDLETPSS